MWHNLGAGTDICNSFRIRVSFLVRQGERQFLRRRPTIEAKASRTLTVTSEALLDTRQPKIIVVLSKGNEVAWESDSSFHTQLAVGLIKYRAEISLPRDLCRGTRQLETPNKNPVSRIVRGIRSSLQPLSLPPRAAR